MKRLVDVLAAAFGLALLAPLFAAVSLLIKLTSPGPVFHRAQRVGKGRQPFRIYKFRSMIAGAERAGPGITAAGDARVTPLGRWLRMTKVDELPQLINVLRGDMSLVGPRPEDPRYVERYTPEQRRVLEVSPGVTSAASVLYRNEESFLTGPDWERKYIEVVLPHKLSIELDYLRRRTIASDLDLIVKTLLALICRRRMP